MIKLRLLLIVCILFGCTKQEGVSNTTTSPITTATSPIIEEEICQSNAFNEVGDCLNYEFVEGALYSENYKDKHKYILNTTDYESIKEDLGFLARALSKLYFDWNYENKGYYNLWRYKMISYDDCYYIYVENKLKYIAVDITDGIYKAFGMVILEDGQMIMDSSSSAELRILGNTKGDTEEYHVGVAGGYYVLGRKGNNIYYKETISTCPMPETVKGSC